MSRERADAARAYELFAQGRLQAAEAMCREALGHHSGDAAAMHLLGLVRNALGDPAEAERLLRASIDIEPGQADFHSNLAGMLRAQGRLPEAEAGFRRALGCNPQHTVAFLGLARTVRQLGRPAESATICGVLLTVQRRDVDAWCELASAMGALNNLPRAEGALREALAIHPGNGGARASLGALLVRMDRAEEALVELDRAEALGSKGFEVALQRSSALTQLYRGEEAEAALVSAVTLQPRHPQAQLNLARVRFQQGDPKFARSLAAAAAEHRDDLTLQILHARVMRDAGDLSSAESVLRDVLARRGPVPEARSELAAVLHASGRLPEAENEALEAATARPGDPDIVEVLVTVLLASGRAADAQPFIQTQRLRAPYLQQWIAYEATVARLLGQPRYRELYDYDRFVRAYDIEPPAGWSSIAELNAALLQALDLRHRFVAHPPNQTWRQGSRTARSLLTESDPAIRSVLQAFIPPLTHYLEAIGTEAGHPFTERNGQGVNIVTAWSVQLGREGFHLSHVHPDGWISSAYYVGVPAEAVDIQSMFGWLKFGEPPNAPPGAEAERVVQPLPGRLVLFPSYLWHGTTPIHGSEPRTAIAFDAVPAPPDPT